ncbi:MAG: hypothetical protein J5I93_13450, partial [Pirellulaceae bacterium]|nr:hypothetical protein [Pirellulaceae bacterium]
TLALCLARAAARAGVRVALLEADYGSRQIAARLGVDTPCDWPQTARRGVSWTEAAIWSIEDRITVLPLAEEDDEPPLRLDEPAVTRLIDQLRGQFELLIIDTPPLGDPQGDFFAAGDECPIDAVILVRDQRVAVASHTQQVVRRIREAGIEAVGLAHNYCKHPNP